MLLSGLGMVPTLLMVALVVTLTSLLVAKVWENNPMLYLFSIVLGGVTGGFILTWRSEQRAGRYCPGGDQLLHDPGLTGP